MRSLRILLALTLSLTSLVVASAGSHATNAGSIAVDSVDLTDFPVIRVGATVAGINAKPDPSLGLANFEVTQSGVPVRGLETRRDQTGPVDVILAIDLSGSQVNFIENSKRAAIDVVNSLAPTDRVQVIGFGNQTEPILALTSDRGAIGDVLNGLVATPNSNTAFNSALLSAVQAADASATTGRAVVVFSDGEEFGGRSPAIEGQIGEIALGRGIQVYSVYVGNQEPSVLFNEIPVNTGGLRLNTADAATIGDHITETLRSKYVIQFVNSAPPDADPAEIVVRVKSRDTLETAINACDGQSTPFAWIPGIDDGQKVTGERRLQPQLLCAGGRTIQDASFFVGEERVATVASPPFTYTLLTDKLERESHVLRVELALSDGSRVSSRPLSVTVSGSPFNPAFLLIILGLGAAMIVAVFALIRRKQRGGTSPAPAAVAVAIGPALAVSSATAPAMSQHSTESSAISSRQGLLRVIRGPTEGQTYQLGPSLTLGRAPSADVLLSGSSVSREHARIWLDGGIYRIRDLGSTNGTLVNGHRVTEATLAAGDKIEIRPFVFEFGG